MFTICLRNSARELSPRQRSIFFSVSGSIKKVTCFPPSRKIGRRPILVDPSLGGGGFRIRFGFIGTPASPVEGTATSTGAADFLLRAGLGLGASPVACAGVGGFCGRLRGPVAFGLLLSPATSSGSLFLGFFCPVGRPGPFARVGCTVGGPVSFGKSVFLG